MRISVPLFIATKLAIFWCIAGVMIHGWTILLYPLVWLAIGSMFIVHHTQFAQPKKTQPVAKVQLDNPNWSQPVVETPPTVAPAPQTMVSTD